MAAVVLADEVLELYRGNFTFSTYPEDIGVTFEMTAVMSMSNQLGAAVKNAKFRIETYVPGVLLLFLSFLFLTPPPPPPNPGTFRSGTTTRPTTSCPGTHPRSTSNSKASPRRS
jgi:hypothetical protein